MSVKRKPRKDWASISAPGIVVEWDRDHPLFAVSKARIERMVADGMIQ